MASKHEDAGSDHTDSSSEMGTAQAAERRMMRYSSDPDIQT